jgi:hypothetical protein
LVSGIADAVAPGGEGEIEVVVDWKSDVDVDDKTLTTYRGQIGAYHTQTGAKRALLVLMTPGRVVEI